MALPTFPRLERPWMITILGLGAALLILPEATLGLGIPLLALTVQALMLAAFFVVRRFARVWVSGAVGGIVVGIVVLGVALRIAMRVVAILDPVRRPEFTGETMFVLFVGGFFGLALGLWIAVAERLWAPRATAIGVVIGAIGITAFLLEEGIRDELFGLGAGPIVNIPMFFLCFALFGWAAAVVIARLQRVLPMTPGRSLTEDETPVPVSVTV